MADIFVCFSICQQIETASSLPPPFLSPSLPLLAPPALHRPPPPQSQCLHKTLTYPAGPSHHAECDPGVQNSCAQASPPLPARPSVFCSCLTPASEEKQHLLGPDSWAGALGTRRGAFPIAELSAPREPGPLAPRGLILNLVALEEREVRGQLREAVGSAWWT